jgi:hypothetical protein
MRNLGLVVPLVLAAFLAAIPAQACRISVPLAPEDVGFANTVLIGRVENYRIIRHDPSGRTPDAVAKSADLIWDYALFDVIVDEVLVGKAPKRISITWDNSTFGEPDTLPSGPFLIALRDPTAPIPPLRGPSGTIFPAPRQDLPTLLQAPCSSPFLLPVADAEARAVRAILATKTKPKPKPKPTGR